jgi:hypothetical protein
VKIVKKMRAVKVTSFDGDSHYELVEISARNALEYEESLSEEKAKEITKTEAQKLLLIVREE